MFPSGKAEKKKKVENNEAAVSSLQYWWRWYPFGMGERCVFILEFLIKNHQVTNIN